MSVHSCLNIVALALALFAAGSQAAEPAYPTKPVRVIVPYPPGGTTDPTARAFTGWFTEKMGANFVIDNRPGAGSTLGHGLGAKATPDGYTLLLGTSGGLVVSAAFGSKLAYDPVKDFTPIGVGVYVPFLIVVHPSVPAKSVSELLLLAKQRPGELNYSSSSTGSSPHLAAELFKSMAGINIVRVPYKGSSQALVGLVGGQVHLMFPNAGTVAPHLKSTRVRALAVTTSAPSALVPGLPTLSASGVTGYESASQFALFVPAGTPSAIIERLNREMIAALRKPDVTERLFGSGVEVTTGTPAELAATMKSEMAKWGKLIKEAGIREE